MKHSVVIHPQVRAAFADGAALVALETAVVTHGLPRTPLASESAPTLPEGVVWESDAPANLATARMLEDCVRAAGAVPATVAVIDGTLKIGLDAGELERLALDVTAMKASARDLPAAIAQLRCAGTTVAATLAACRVAASIDGGAPIRVFVTGGIGGAHQGWARTGDVSADLRAIAETSICVVSSGAKSILDLGATLEMLDMLSVPVVGYGTDHFPRFHSVGDDRLAVPLRLDELGDVAHLCQRHWRDLGGGGVLLAVPIAARDAVDSIEVETTMAVAEERARVAKIKGAALTPFLLETMASESGGRLVRANIALLARNATVGAGLARQLSMAC